MTGLHKRTGGQGIIIWTRGENVDWNPPAVITTSIVPERYFLCVYKEDIEDFAHKFEAHVLQGPSTYFSVEHEFKLAAESTSRLIMRQLSK